MLSMICPIGRRTRAAAAMLAMTATAARVCADCPADVDPAGGNGVVNVSDLLAVINHWGPCAPPCPPRCGTDIMPLATGNCATDVNDLLAVINGWGACPCSPSGSWASAPPAAYTCAFGLVQFNITQWIFGGSATIMSVSGAPVLMTGPAVVCGAGQVFTVTGSLPGTCTETYALSGTFTSPNQFTGTFTATYVGSACRGPITQPPCTNQSWNITATRIP